MLPIRRVAVFDHDPEVLDEAHAALTLRGYDVYPFDNPADSIGAACGVSFELAIIEVFWKGKALGLKIAGALHKRHTAIRVAMISWGLDVASALWLREQPCVDRVFQKPVDWERLVSEIEGRMPPNVPDLECVKSLEVLRREHTRQNVARAGSVRELARRWSVDRTTIQRWLREIEDPTPSANEVRRGDTRQDKSSRGSA